MDRGRPPALGEPFFGAVVNADAVMRAVLEALPKLLHDDAMARIAEQVVVNLEEMGFGIVRNVPPPEDAREDSQVRLLADAVTAMGELLDVRLLALAREDEGLAPRSVPARHFLMGSPEPDRSVQAVRPAHGGPVFRRVQQVGGDLWELEATPGSRYSWNQISIGANSPFNGMELVEVKPD